MKEANLNALRTSHYPPLPEALDLADELGLYVEAEGSFCWVNVADDLRFTPRILQLNAELLARDRNHPSVFTWSICNESAFGSGFVRSHEWLRAADPTRPHAGSWDPGHVEFHAQHNPITIADIEQLENRTARFSGTNAGASSRDLGRRGRAVAGSRHPGLLCRPLPPIYARMMASPRHRRHPDLGLVGRHLLRAEPRIGVWPRNGSEPFYRKPVSTAAPRTGGRRALGRGRWLAPRETGILDHEEAPFAGQTQGRRAAASGSRAAHPAVRGEPV